VFFGVCGGNFSVFQPIDGVFALSDSDFRVADGVFALKNGVCRGKIGVCQAKITRIQPTDGDLCRNLAFVTHSLLSGARVFAINRANPPENVRG